MEAHKLGKRIEAEFSGEIEWAAPTAKRLYLVVPPPLMLELLDSLRQQIDGFRLGTATAIDLRESVGVFYHFCINGTSLVVTAKVYAPKPDPRVPSVASRIPSARWIEREMSEMAGVIFEGHPDPRPLHKARAFGDETKPLRRDFDVEEHKEKIGEQLDW
jgi:Ni,Fe-hydrogenase III component G